VSLLSLLLDFAPKQFLELVKFIDDCIGEEALERTQTVRNGEVL